MSDKDPKEEVLATLSRAVPRIVTTNLLDGDHMCETVKTVEFNACVVFADVSGFTRLAESLSSAEELTSNLNTYFDKMMDIIFSYGGDLVRFAGDALLLAWVDQHLSLAEVTHAATAAVMEMQDKLSDYEVTDGISLTLHTGVGSGWVKLLSVGGVGGRREYVLVGEPIHQISEALERTSKGESVLSPAAYSLVIDHCQAGSELDGGYFKCERIAPPTAKVPLNKVKLDVDKHLPLLRGYVPKSVADRVDAGYTQAMLSENRRVTCMFVLLPGLDYQTTESIDFAQKVVIRLQHILEATNGALRQFMLDDKGCVLIACFGLPGQSGEDDPVRAVTAAEQMRTSLTELQVTCSIGITTGTVFAGSVGNADRFEYAMVGDLVNLSARLAGVAKGDIISDRATRDFASKAGTAFTTLRPVKVKGKAQPIDIFSPLSGTGVRGTPDPAQSPAPGDGAAAEPEELVELLGREEFLTLFGDSLDRLSNPGTLSQTICMAGDHGIGKTHLFHDYTRVASRLNVCCVAIKGTSVRQMTTYGTILDLCRGVSDAWNCTYSLTRQVMLDFPELRLTAGQSFPDTLSEILIGQRAAGARTEQTGVTQTSRGSKRSQKSIQSKLSNLMPRIPGAGRRNSHHSRAPGTQARPVSTDVRLQAAQLLLLKGLQQAVDHYGQVVFVIDDVNFIDEMSAKLLLSVVRKVPNMLLCVSHPPDANPPAGIGLGARDIRRELPPLNADSIVSLARAALGTGSATLGRTLREYVIEKSQGNPFYCRHLVESLNKAGALVIVNNECVFAGNVNPDKLEVPTSLRGIIASRFDRLHYRVQLLLKVLSCFASEFGFGLIRAVVGEISKTNENVGRLLGQNLKDDMEELVMEKFLNATTKAGAETRDGGLGRLEGDSGAGGSRGSLPGSNHASEIVMMGGGGAINERSVFSFANNTMQEVVNSLMLDEHRRMVHQVCAEFLGGLLTPESPAQEWARVANHYRQGEMHMESLMNWLEAGDRFDEDGAVRNAYNAYSHALDSVDKYGEKLEPLPMLKLLRHLGDQVFSLGSVSELWGLARRGAALCGVTIPAGVLPTDDDGGGDGAKASTFQLKLRARKELDRHLWLVMTGARYRGKRDEATIEFLVEGMRLLSGVCMSLVVSSNFEPVALVAISLATINFGIRAAHTPTFARMLAVVGNSFHTIGQTTLGAFFQRRALSHAEDTKDDQAVFWTMFHQASMMTAAGKFNQALRNFIDMQVLCSTSVVVTRYPSGAMSSQSATYYFAGLYDKSLSIAREYGEMARKQDQVFLHTASIAMQTGCLLRIGENDTANDLVEQAAPRVIKGDKAVTLMLMSCKATAAMRLHDHDTAFEMLGLLRPVVSTITGVQASLIRGLTFYTLLIRELCVMSEEEPLTEERQKLLEFSSDTALKLCRLAAQTINIALPIAIIAEANALAIQDRLGSAQLIYKVAAKKAWRLKMTYEQAVAVHHMARNEAKRGRFHEAKRRFVESLTLYAQVRAGHDEKMAAAELRRMIFAHLMVEDNGE